MLSELRIMWRISLPLIAAYLAEFLMFLSTKTIVGKLGYRELAAVGIAGDLVFEVSVILIGFLSVIGVLIAQSDGAGDKSAAGVSTSQGLLIATLLACPAFVLIWNMDKVLLATGQTPEVVALASPFLASLSTMIFPLLWFSVLRTFVTAMSSTGIIMVITTVAVILNYFLTIILVHGKFGLEPLGLTGAGMSLSIINWLMFMALLAHVVTKKSYKPYKILGQLGKVDSEKWREIFVLGIPVAGLVVLEAGLFVAVPILSGVLGTEELAAGQILMGWVGIPFVVALGIANATMVRVASGVGRNDIRGSRLSGYCGLLTGIVILVLMAAIPMSIPEFIISRFLRPEDPGRTEIAFMVRQLLLLVAFFQIFDGIQVISSHALRGLRDTMVPLWIATTGYWILGIGGGSIMAFTLEWGLTGLWAGLALGLTVTGTLLAVRFCYLVTSKPAKVLEQR